MKGQFLNRIVKKVAGLFRPAPSVFDFCLAGSLFINFIKQDFQRNIFFIFYIIFTICMTLVFDKKRNYKSLPLMLLSLWGLLSIFIHSYFIYPNSITFFYLNIYLMFEGFIYLFFGILFLFAIIRYSRNIRFLYLLMPLILLPWIKDIYRIGRIKYTPFFSLLLALVTYFILKRKYIRSILLSMIGSIVFLLNYNSIIGYFSTRILMFKELIKDILSHPFIGTGFNKTLNPDNMKFIIEGRNGWLWRYNDTISLGAYIGIFAIICLVWFMIETVRKIGFNYHLVIFLTIILISSFQMTVFFVEKAVSCLLLTGLCLVQSYPKEEKYA
jgi:hypothetical protein